MKRLANDRNRELQRAAQAHGINLTLDDARTLRRAEMTLHRWAERRCGWATPGQYGASMALVRCSDHGDDDDDGKPYLEIHPNVGLQTRWESVPDLERGALKRVQRVCEKYGASYYHQSDPRGAALYISDREIDAASYNQAVSCAIR
jgi:hypothetical protein